MPELMYDEFKLHDKVQLNNDDIDSLTKLYLPLMGIDSYALYLGLSSLDAGVAYNYKTLLDTLQFKSLNGLNKASSKLEALNLINLYKDKDNNYLYIINRPLPFDIFLKDEAFCTLLASKISMLEVDKLKERYIKKISKYKNITKSFEEVFEIKKGDDLTFIKSLLPKQIEIENKEFNYALFKMLFENTFITEDVLETEELKRNIIRLSFVYKLSEEEMKDALLAAFSIDKDLSYASISRFASLAYRNREKDSVVTLVTKEDDDYLTSIKDDDSLALCSRLEAMSPSEVLETYNGGKKASEAEIKMFDKLSKDTLTPIPLINLMIVYSVVNNNGDIPGYSYFEKIAATWKRAKIKNVYDGIKHLSAKAKEREEKNVKGKKEVSLPSWYSSYKEELDKKISENEELNSKNSLDILEAAKGLFGDDDE